MTRATLQNQNPISGSELPFRMKTRLETEPPSVPEPVPAGHLLSAGYLMIANTGQMVPVLGSGSDLLLRWVEEFSWLMGGVTSRVTDRM